MQNIEHLKQKFFAVEAVQFEENSPESTRRALGALVHSIKHLRIDLALSLSLDYRTKLFHVNTSPI